MWKILAVLEHIGRGESQRATVRMAECEPGELPEVDFGRLGLVSDPETDHRRLAWALVIVLVHSRHQYVHITFSQKLPDFINGLEDVWLWFGGVPRRLAVDNMKAAIIKADRYNPVFQRTFEEYARHRGFVIDATRSRDPTGNAIAESFFGTLECELLDRYTFRTPAEAGQAVFRYIEGWYNPRRRHSALDYLSPAKFEAKNWSESVGIPGLTEAPAAGEGHLAESGSTPLQAAEALLTPRKEEEEIKLKEMQHLPVH